MGFRRHSDAREQEVVVMVGKQRGGYEADGRLLTERLATPKAGSGIRLTPEERREVVRLTGLDAYREAADALISEIEDVLGLHPFLLETLAGAPPPAEKRTRLEPLIERAGELLRVLQGKDTGLWFDFALHGYDFERERRILSAALGSFVDGGGRVLYDLAGREPEQSPAEQALHVLTTDLRHLFDSHSLVRGSSETIQRRRTRFVEHCLDAAGISRGIQPFASVARTATVA